jgi:glycine dehydrogenase subunit 1
MLKRIGVGSIQELFDDIPKALRFPELGLPAPYSELDCMAELESLAAENLSSGATLSFWGAGAWNHLIPSVVPFLAGRGEFATAYTPYQAEAAMMSVNVSRGERKQVLVSGGVHPE